MGMNYYAIQKADDDLKSILCEKIMAEDFAKVREYLPRKIHIGKSSVGWKFLFNHNKWRYFDNDYKSMETFLLNCQIVDEYDRDVSFEEFWKMVDSKSRSDSNIEGGTQHFGLDFNNYTEFS